MADQTLRDRLETTLDNLDDALVGIERETYGPLSLRVQVRQRPRTMFGAAVAAGGLLGSIGRGGEARARNGGTRYASAS